jgi:hypothetical protein
MTLILDGTNGLSDVDGTAATPAIRGTDANTGIFFPAADTIAFAEGGAEAMRINSSGFVGIGTTNPGYALDVRGGNPTIRVSRSGTAGQVVALLFEDGNATLGAGSTTRIASDAGAMSFSTGGTSGSDTGGTERARIDSSGRLTMTSQPAFRARLSSDQSVTTNAATKIAYNTEDYDVGSNFDTSTNRFTAPIAGKYLFVVVYNPYGITSGDNSQSALYKNGASAQILSRNYSDNTSDHVYGGSVIFNLAASDYIEVFTQSTDTSYGLSGGNVWNSFSGYLLG